MLELVYACMYECMYLCMHMYTSHDTDSIDNGTILYVSFR